MSTYRKMYPLVIVLLMLFLVSLACSSSDNTGTLVEEAPPQDESAEASKPDDTAPESESSAAQLETFKLGDAIQVKDYTMVLQEVKLLGNNTLQLTFSFANQGSDEVNISSLLSFEAKDDDGTKLEQEFFDCGPGLDGAILAGDKLKGNICYKLTNPAMPVRVYYQDNIFSSGATVWQVAPEDFGKSVAAPDPSDSTESSSIGVTIYKPGDVVQLSDHTIMLNSFEFVGNVLKANFTVENQGTSDLAMSSLLSFEAKNSEGEKLEIEIFDCGTSGLDGSVLPGDKLRGDICWSTGGDQDIKVYYQANLLSSGAIVWSTTE